MSRSPSTEFSGNRNIRQSNYRVFNKSLCHAVQVQNFQETVISGSPTTESLGYHYVTRPSTESSGNRNIRQSNYRVFRISLCHAVQVQNFQEIVISGSQTTESSGYHSVT
jgi:hypothetical protein